MNVMGISCLGRHIRRAPANVHRAAKPLPSAGFSVRLARMEKQHPEDERRRQSDAILTRVRQETEPQTGAGIERIVLDARRHFGAADADQSDRMEVLGTRIGRLAGLAFFLFLAGSLIITYLIP